MVRVVQHIIKLRPQLQGDSLVELEILEHRKIHIGQFGSGQRISPHVSERPAIRESLSKTIGSEPHSNRCLFDCEIVVDESRVRWQAGMEAAAVGDDKAGWALVSASIRVRKEMIERIGRVRERYRVEGGQRIACKGPDRAKQIGKA